MRARTELENALEEAIGQKRFEKAKQLINLIQTDSIEINGSSLESQDLENRSFLCFALAAGAEGIATYLLQLQEDKPNIIYKVDEDKRTLISYAAERGYNEILKKLITLSESEQSDSYEYKIWLSVDRNGNSPLMWAVKSQNFIATELLLNKICREENAIEIINSINLDGKNPLDLAIAYDSKEIAELLIRSGADITTWHKRKFPSFAMTKYLALHGVFIGHHNLPDNLKIQLIKIAQTEDIPLIGSLISDVSPNCITPKFAALAFKSASEDEQAHRLFYCQKALRLNPALNDVRTFYFTCLASYRNLKELLLAQTIFYEKKPLIPLEQFNKMPAELRELILPSYFERIRRQENSTQGAGQEIGFHREPYLAYMYIEADSKTINNYIMDIRAILILLSAMPKEQYCLSQRKMLLTRILIPLCIVSLLAGLSYSIFDMRILPVLFISIMLISVFLIAVLTVCMAFLNSKYETRVSPNDYRGLIDTLKKDVVDKLNHLRNLEEQQNFSDSELTRLPIKPGKLDDLNMEINRFNEIKLHRDMIELFTNLEEILFKIKEEIILKGKPFSMFYKQSKPEDFVSIDINNLEESDEDSETRGLLSSSYIS